MYKEQWKNYECPCCGEIMDGDYDGGIDGAYGSHQWIYFCNCDKFRKRYPTWPPRYNPRTDREKTHETNPTAQK